MRIYLIRHAEREGNSALPEKFRPLSPKGENQAKVLAKRLETQGIPTLFLSKYVQACSANSRDTEEYPLPGSSSYPS